MKPEWRKPGVIALCEAMLNDHDFTALPILADALEEAGCPGDHPLMVACRTHNENDIANRITVCRIYSEKTATALEEIEAFAKRYNFFDIQKRYPGGHFDRSDPKDPYKWVEDHEPPNADALQEVIAEAMSPAGYLTAHGSDLHGAGELDPGEEDAFWKNMAIVTGNKYGAGHRRNFGWSCSC